MFVCILVHHATNAVVLFVLLVLVSIEVFDLFKEHISPKSNALIVIVELKRLLQGSMSLEDFHTKALRLVKEADYPEGDTQNRVLRDTIVSGLASDKIQSKVIKEGKDVTLATVMEITRLAVSTQ